MSNIIIICRRELLGYFTTPLGYVFIAIFLNLTAVFTFSMGNFYEAGQASLDAFFSFHPWLYLFLVPAISMRLWAEERKSGTVELLFTLPISLGQAVVGKYLAALIFLALGLASTFPIVLTVFYLGDPDGGVIFSGYLGSILMASAYLSIGCCISATTKNQVISFVVSIMLCFMFLLASFPIVLAWFQGWAPQAMIDAITAISFNTHFESIQRGVFALKDAIFFLSMAVGWLFVCAVVLDAKKAS